MIGIGFTAYMRQWDLGLGITSMGRDISWGLYIANFTFLVGVAASVVMVVLPYYLHNFKIFARITIFGEFLAVAAVTMAVLFIFVDLGQPNSCLQYYSLPVSTFRLVLGYDCAQPLSTQTLEPDLSGSQRSLPLVFLPLHLPPVLPFLSSCVLS